MVASETTAIDHGACGDGEAVFGWRTDVATTGAFHFPGGAVEAARQGSGRHYGSGR